MRKIFRKIYHTPILFLLFLIIFIFAFPAFDLDSESMRLAVVSTLGIDKVGDEIEVSCLILVPKATQSFSEKYKLVTAKDSDLPKALDRVGLHIGREIVLGHTMLVLVNEDLTKENLTPVFDYLIKTYNLGNRTIVVSAENSAKDLLAKSLKLEESSGLKLEDLVHQNEKYMYALDSNIESFYKGVFGPNKSSFMNIISLSEKDTEGVSIDPAGSQSGGSQGSSGSSGGSGGSGGEESAETPPEGQSPPKGQSKDNKNYISNNGDARLFVDGKSVAKLSSQEVHGLNWINPSANRGFLSVYHVNSAGLNDATVTFSFRGETVKNKVYFENGKPIIYYDLTVILMLEEIIRTNQNEIDANQQFTLDEELKRKINSEIKKEFANTLKIMKEHNADALNVYEIFNRQAHKDWQKFLKSLEKPEEYLKHVTFLMNTNSFLYV